MRILLLSIVVMTLGITNTALGAVRVYQQAPNREVGQSVPPTIHLRADAELQRQCTSCTFITYRLVRQLNCGGSVEVRPLGPKPRCKMIPRVTHNGAVELLWGTANAVTAFIDNGVGHVAPNKNGGRIITPHQDTEYNMTVVSEDGLVSNCSARVEIAGALSEPAWPLEPTDGAVVELDIDNSISTEPAPAPQEGFWAWLFSVAHRVWLVVSVFILGLLFVIYHVIAWIIRQVRK